MVRFEDFAKGIGYDERLRLARAYYPKEFSAKEGYSLTRKGLAALTTAQKRKITKNYNIIRPFIGATSQKIYTRSPTKASAAWRSLFGIEPPRGTLFVPVVGNEPRLEYYEEGENDLRVRVRDENVGITKHFFEDYGIDQHDLARDAANILQDLHNTIGGARYSILTGDHMMTQGGAVYVGTIDDIIRQIVRLQNKYGNEKSKNNWREWMFGLQAYNFDDIDEFSDYREEQRETRSARRELTDKLSAINKNIADTKERILINKDALNDFKIERTMLLGGVRGKQRSQFVKTSKIAKNLNANIKRLDKTIKKSVTTLNKNVKAQKSITKLLIT
jgi:hypothetical protein